MEMTTGDLPAKAQELVKEWLAANQIELLKMWDTQKHRKSAAALRRTTMFSRIKKVEPLSDFRLYIEFDEGEPVIYNVGEDIETIPDFQILKTEAGLFNNFQVDESRTCLYWSDRVLK